MQYNTVILFTKYGEFINDSDFSLLVNAQCLPHPYTTIPPESFPQLSSHFVDIQKTMTIIIRKTRNSSGDEIANVNFLYDDIVHVLQNTIDSCINSATYRRGYVLERICLPNSVK